MEIVNDKIWRMEILTDAVWQMSLGERAAIVGILSQLQPELSIEIGTAEGASLRPIAAHSKEVHSFDLVAPSIELPANATLHPGDSHKLLPEFLAELAEQGRNVDFVLVDGDHSADGVRRDIEDLLNSDAVQRSIIVIHDVNNEQVRSGLDGIRYRGWRKVEYVELDAVPGYMFREERLRHELWGGLGVIVVNSGRPSYQDTEVRQQRYYEAAPLFAEMRDTVVARETDGLARRSGEFQTLRERTEALEREVAEAWNQAEGQRRSRKALEQSISWRITKPLRSAKARARRALS